mmetsp:Transcript_14301/g.33294  ORF Transcript_14301/g.33294 Transcript_14301/m.33294 type:complete len:89 (-) Transcript_14301:86-352(-)
MTTYQAQLLHLQPLAKRKDNLSRNVSVVLRSREDLGRKIGLVQERLQSVLGKRRNQWNVDDYKSAVLSRFQRIVFNFIEYHNLSKEQR